MRRPTLKDRIWLVSETVTLDESPIIEAHRPATGRDRALFWWLALPLLALDQVTKWYIVSTIPLYETHVPIPALFPFYKHTHIPNIGSVFGTNQSGSARIWLTILAFVVAIVLVIYNQRLDRASRKLRVALGLVFAGGVGNLLDRIRFGHVTDFVDLDFSSLIPLGIADWYIFNVADLAVVIAIFLMGYLTFFEPEQIEGPTEAKPSIENSAETIHASETIVAESASDHDAYIDQPTVDQEQTHNDV